MKQAFHWIRNHMYITYFLAVALLWGAVGLYNLHLNNEVPSNLASDGCYSSTDAASHYGEQGCVDYMVGYTYETAAGTEFLDEKQDYNTGFVGYIPASSSVNPDYAASLQGDAIRVSGTITQFSGHPQIEIDNSSQVTVLH